MRSTRIVGYTIGGCPVYSDEDNKVNLGGDCHYVPSQANVKEVDMVEDRARRRNRRISKTQPAKRTDGVKVLAVKKNGPADYSGIIKNDRITKVNGRHIYYASQIADALTNVNPGRTTSITVDRDGKNHDFLVVTNTKKNGKAGIGVFTRTKSAQTYLDAVARANKNKEKDDMKKKTEWAEHARKITAEKKAEKNVEVTEKTRCCLSKDDGIESIAARAAAKDSVTEAKADVMKRIEDDANFFQKKAAIELAQVEEMLKDRKGAEAYLAARAMKIDLEAENKRKLLEAGNKVNAYIGRHLEESAARDGAVSKGKLKLTKLGWAVVGILVSLAAAGGGFYIFG